jgi:hypothetical protein
MLGHHYEDEGWRIKVPGDHSGDRHFGIKINTIRSDKRHICVDSSAGYLQKE